MNDEVVPTGDGTDIESVTPPALSDRQLPPETSLDESDAGHPWRPWNDWRWYVVPLVIVSSVWVTVDDYGGVPTSDPSLRTAFSADLLFSLALSTALLVGIPTGIAALARRRQNTDRGPTGSGLQQVAGIAAASVLLAVTLFIAGLATGPATPVAEPSGTALDEVNTGATKALVADATIKLFGLVSLDRCATFLPAGQDQRTRSALRTLVRDLRISWAQGLAPPEEHDPVGYEIYLRVVDTQQAGDELIISGVGNESDFYLDVDVAYALAGDYLDDYRADYPPQLRDDEGNLQCDEVVEYFTDLSGG